MSGATAEAEADLMPWDDEPTAPEAEPRDHIREAVASAFLSLTGKPASEADILAFSSAVHERAVVAEATRLVKASTEQASKATASIRTGPPLATNVADYLSGVPTEIPWLAPPFVYFGGISLLAGIWKGGKSTLLAQLMLARESETQFLGQDIPNGPTLYITEEGGIPVRYKVGDLKKLYIIDRRSAVTSETSFDGLQGEIRAWCATVKDPALILIDTLAVWAEIEDENTPGQLTKVLNGLAVLAQETGAAIILVDHIRKEGGTHGRGIRGSGAKAATVDIFATLDRPDRGEKTDRVLSLEGRVIQPQDLRLSFEPYSKTYSVIDKKELEQDEMDQLLVGIPEVGEGLGITDLMKLWDKDRRHTAAKADWLVNATRLKMKSGKRPGNNANLNLYWAIPRPDAGTSDSVGTRMEAIMALEATA